MHLYSFMNVSDTNSQGKRPGHRCTSVETSQVGQTSALDPERRRKKEKLPLTYVITAS